jgi:NagD protein
MVTGRGRAGLDERTPPCGGRAIPDLGVSGNGGTGNHGRVTETPQTSPAPSQVPDARPPWSFLMDMDGVLVHEEQAIRGAPEFIAALRDRGAPFLVLTNNSIYTRRDLAARLRASGLDVPEDRIWTSALATATFLEDQRPGGSAFVIGEAGLTTALHEAGYTLTERNPDYVILGETRTYSFSQLTRAIRLIEAGARFIATNPDPTGPSAEGSLPATGSVAALVSRATNVAPYFVGKPNPLMMRSALNAIEAHSEDTAMIGDRMDTDVVSGLEAGLHTILVLTGVATAEAAERFPYRPSRIVDSVADLVDEVRGPEE